jgi:hypothetical protein
MTLYDILQDGFHTPLTEAQISELFQAGRLNRHTRCKPAGTSQCRTIDELFPLLKYHAPWRLGYQSPESSTQVRSRRAIVAGIGLVTAAAAALTVYFYLHGRSLADRQVTAIDDIPSLNPPLLVRQASVVPSRPIYTTVSVSPATPFFDNTPTQIVVAPAEQSQTNPQLTVRLAETKRIEEQARREQVLADQQRARERALLEQQEAAGRDEHVPLDQWQVVNVGGESVRVKIHDNDVTSFDVWINGQWRHEVPKAHGITHSRTDETLIYSNGRSALYYVWEISGKLNHCLLRVRDS